jgi:Zn ribbon nucleic-acid-binding protein
MTILFLKDNAKTLSQFDFSILTTFFADNWKIIVGLLGLTLILTFIIQRFIVLKKRNKRSDTPFFGFVTTSSDRLLTDDYSKFNVKWAVRTMNGHVHVDYTPLCPQCKTELQEKITFWNKFKWTCVHCNFSIKQKDSQNNIREDVQIIAEGEMRRAGQGRE